MIPITLIKSCIDLIPSPLVDIFNCSFKTGIFPDLFKAAVVTPLHKKGSTRDKNCFRPISLLNCFSKTLEKLVHVRFSTYLESHSLLNDQQFGFRACRSTSDAVTNCFLHLERSLASKHHTLGLFCDLSKPFDCVDSSILQKKLPYYGVSGNSLQWFSSYLRDRSQITKISYVENGVKLSAFSSVQDIKSGVPQGSVLGPLLFLVFINDLIHSTDQASFTLFADDTTVLVSGRTEEDVFIKANKVLSDICGWFTANRLKLNQDKTSYLYFNPHRDDSLPSIKAHNITVNPNNDVKFLGLFVDKNLKWVPHIIYLSKKLATACFAICAVRKNITSHPALLTYFSYFHSLMSYGLLYWGFSPHASTVFLYQKRAVRSILGLPSTASCKPLFSRFNILTLYGQLILDSCLMIHKNSNNFKKYRDIHTHNTRNRNNLIPSKEKKFSNSLLNSGIQLYNSLPENYKSLTERKLKTVLKDRLLEICPYSVNEFYEKARTLK
ncbi:hypothetical protein WDU94_000587 [Cyamophila willieti]